MKAQVLKRHQPEQRLGHPANVYLVPLTSAHRDQISYTQHHCVYNHVTFNYGPRHLPARIGFCIPKDFAKFGSSWVTLRYTLDHKTDEGCEQWQSDAAVPNPVFGPKETWPLLGRTLPKLLCQETQSGRHGYHRRKARKPLRFVYISYSHAYSGEV